MAPAGALGARDPRIAELEKMGVARAHVRVAEQIGFDAFIAMWRIYDEEQAFRTEKGDLEIPMRAFRSYLRFQRNRVIESLVAEGRTVNEIRQHLREKLGETVGPRHIRRLRSGR